jgi:hypothetical protein
MQANTLAKVARRPTRALAPKPAQFPRCDPCIEHLFDGRAERAPAGAAHVTYVACAATAKRETISSGMRIAFIGSPGLAVTHTTVRAPVAMRVSLRMTTQE